MNRISKYARKLILDDLVLIGCCTGGTVCCGIHKKSLSRDSRANMATRCAKNTCFK